MSLPVYQKRAYQPATILAISSPRSSRSSHVLGFAVLGAIFIGISCISTWLFASESGAHAQLYDADAYRGEHRAERMEGVFAPTFLSNSRKRPQFREVGRHGGQEHSSNDIYYLILGKVACIATPIAAITFLGRSSWQSCAATFIHAKKSLRSIDFQLLFCFVVWYFGNYQHNICNKLALRAAGGAEGFPFTIATLQMVVGSVYALFLWVAPDARIMPAMTFHDWVATLPVSFAAACAHAGSVFALSAGALSFGQIAKAAEPAFAAGVGTMIYGSKVSAPRMMCLLPIIGGVALSSLAELDFAWGALLAASIANFAAAIRGNENKKLMSTEGVRDRLGSVGNQFAITTLNALLFLVPLALYREGHKLPALLKLVQTDRALLWNIVLSGWWFYIYNEVATVIIEKTSPVTQSVANTAKRAIVIVLGAMVLGESLNFIKLLGCSIAIGGVFLYSEVDKLALRFQSWRKQGSTRKGGSRVQSRRGSQGSTSAAPHQNAAGVAEKAESPRTPHFDVEAPRSRQVSYLSREPSPMARQSSSKQHQEPGSKDATPMSRQLSHNYHKGSLSTFYDEPEDTDNPMDKGKPARAVQSAPFQPSPSFHLEDTGLSSDSDRDDDRRDTASTADCEDAGAVQVTQEVSGSDSDLERPAPLGKVLCRQLSEQPRARKCSLGDDWTSVAMNRRQITDPMPMLKRGMKCSRYNYGSLSTFYD